MFDLLIADIVECLKVIYTAIGKTKPSSNRLYTALPANRPGFPIPITPGYYIRAI